MRNFKIFLQIYCITFLLFSSSAFGEKISPADSFIKSGNLFVQEKKWELALKEFEKAVEADPKKGFAHASKGVALSRLQQHKDALLAYEKAMYLGYDHSFFRYNRGLSFARLNLIEEAEKEFKAALKLDSRMVMADYDLGVIYKLQGRYEEASAQIQKLMPRNEKLAKKLFDIVPSPYKVITIDNGGTLKGRVSIKGTPPSPRAFHLIHAPNIKFCSRMSDGKGHRFLFDFRVSEMGGLKDTVISIKGIERGKPFSTDMYSFKARLCHAKDYIVASRNGADFLLENLDPIQHEIATYEIRQKGKSRKVKQKTNKPLPPQSSQVRSIFVRPETKEFMVKCNLHPFLQTTIRLVDNPYYVISDSNGEFSIDGIPPGTYEVSAWHPYITEKKGTITVTANGVANLDFEFNSEDEKRSLYHNDLEGYRFNTWYDSEEKFYGGKRVDDPVEVLQTFDPKTFRQH
jgi:tetratricopeptide (TPR) repeat protein